MKIIPNDFRRYPKANAKRRQELRVIRKELSGS
jgi:hypothetical protein